MLSPCASALYEGINVKGFFLKKKHTSGPVSSQKVCFYFLHWTVALGQPGEKAYLSPPSAPICGFFLKKAYLRPRFKPKGMLFKFYSGGAPSVMIPAQPLTLQSQAGRPLSQKGKPSPAVRSLKCFLTSSEEIQLCSSPDRLPSASASISAACGSACSAAKKQS